MKKWTLLLINLCALCQITFTQVVAITDGDALGPLAEFKNKQYLIRFGAIPGLKSTDGITATTATEYTGINGATYSFTAKDSTHLFVVENTSGGTNLLVSTGTGGFTNIKTFTTTSTGNLPKIRLAPTLQVLGTEEVKRSPNNFIGNKVIFTGIDPAAQILHLWSSEGTTATTVKIVSSAGLDIDVLDDSFGENINGLVYFNGRTTSAENYHLWRTDGSQAGTYPVTTTTGQKLYTLTKSTIENLNGELVFEASTNSAAAGGDLWKTNGTSTGTIMLFSLLYHGNYTNSNTPPKFIGKVFQNKFYFFGNNGTLGDYYLYQTDGTVAGTVLLKNNLNNNIRRPAVDMVIYSDDNYLYFPGKGRKELVPNFFIDWDFYYASQGTPSTTKYIDDINNYPAISYVFKTSDGLIVNAGNNSFKFKGYNKPVKTVFTSSQLNYLGSAFSHKSKVWFSASEGIVNEELWCSDGTQNGTKRFADIIAGPGSSAPKQFFTINNTLFVFAKFGSQSGGYMIYKIGEDYTFNGSQSGNWNNPQNWNAGSTPTTVDNAVIPPGFGVTVDAYGSAKNLTVASPINLSAGNMDIFGNLSLAAKITLNNNTLNLAGNASGISNASGTNYIVTNGTGSLKIESLNTERGIVNLPVGTVANYNPLTISNTGAEDNFSVRVIDSITNTTNNAVNATWEISETIAGGSNVTLTLQWNASQEQPAFDRSQSYLGHYISGSWDFGTAGGATGINPYRFTRNNITSFSPFAILNNSGVVPLKFLSFSAQKCNNNQICLNWKTANEQNVSHFEVERSSDGRIFTNIKNISAQNLSLNIYSCNDKLNGITDTKVYYRIRQIDWDGKSSYSAIQVISLSKTITFALYPNPAVSSVNILGWENAQQAVVIDASGKKLLDEAVTNPVLDISKLPVGIYTIELLLKNRKTVFLKLIKQ